MVSRNYTVQSDRTVALNAKSPNDAKTHNNLTKTKQNIHYKQTSVGTQYNSKEYNTKTYLYSTPIAKAKYEKGTPTYTPTVNQDLSPNQPENQQYGINNTEVTKPKYMEPIYQAYTPNITTFQSNVDTYPMKSFKVRPPTPNLSSNSNNLPTIAENIVEEAEYPVDVGNLDYEYLAKQQQKLPSKCPAGRECCLNGNQLDCGCRDHGLRTCRHHKQYEITDSLKGCHKYKYQGSHPDSLYRVPALGAGVGGGPWKHGTKRLRSSWRVLRWPLALTALCIALALLVYFLMPDINPPLPSSDLNSTDWLQGDDQMYAKRQGSNSSSKNIPKDSKSNISTQPEKPVEEEANNVFQFGYIDDEDGNHRFIELIPASGDDAKTPSPPLYPSNISPSVQYGNEGQDDEKTPKRPLHSVLPITDSYDEKFLTHTFAIFYNKDAAEITTESGENDEQKKSEEAKKDTFTSGHQNSFGIPKEEAEKLKSTTQSAIYNTKVSPTLPTVVDKNRIRSTTVRSKWNSTEDGICHSTRLSMCRGVLPYDLTTLPLVTGITNFQELDAAVPYFDYILRSGCSPRARQFVCSLLEPECKPKGMKILPPCRRACKAIAESCQDVIAGSLELSQVFNCQQYPEHESECIILARGAHCLTGELRCPSDGSCVPSHWRCDNINDCPGGTDEMHCDDQSCAPGEFRCGDRGSCIPEEWVCDSHQDCPGAEDEASCGSSGDGDVISAASYHPRPARVLKPKLRFHTQNPLELSTLKSKTEYDNSKELLMMSDSVVSPMKPMSMIRKKTSDATSTPRVYQVISSSSSVSSSTSLCPKYDPSCRRNKVVASRESLNSLRSSTTTSSTTTTSTTAKTVVSEDPYSDSGTSHSSPCPPNELRCVDGRCITFSQLCDLHTDCSDGADEANCFT